MPCALLAQVSSRWMHVVTVNAWGAGTGAAGDCGPDVGAAATAYVEEVVIEVAMWCKFEAVEVEPGQARCDLIARSLLLQVAC